LSVKFQELAVKVLSSLKSAKSRHRDCKVVRRRGKVFVICKSNPRFKARQRWSSCDGFRRKGRESGLFFVLDPAGRNLAAGADLWEPLQRRWVLAEIWPAAAGSPTRSAPTGLLFLLICSYWSVPTDLFLPVCSWPVYPMLLWEPLQRRWGWPHPGPLPRDRRQVGSHQGSSTGWGFLPD